ncbi:MAG TPA: FHA domain-containing serine/threonine-protein kinase [Ktedonobacterales bacterium]|jgi:serine/threonine protein kinase
MSALIGKKLGQLEVVEQIGQGGMATVYKAYQPALDRFVAIKVLPATYAKDPTFMERFVREARAIAKLYHPHILPVHDFGEQDGTTYIVMEYVSGGTLKRRLKPNQPMPLRDAVDMVLQTCQALECAHQHNIVHRDIKPGNMLLRSDNFLLLSDFGIAKILEANTALTRTGVGIGTPQYMSPEQSTGLPNVGPRSDLYSLGIVLYQAVAGRVPFGSPGDAPLTISLKHVNEPLPPPRQFAPDLPPLVEQVIIKALEKDPDNRFQSATEMIDALNNINMALRGPSIGFSSAFQAVAPAFPAPTSPQGEPGSVGGQPGISASPGSSPQGITCFRCSAVNLQGKLFCTTCGYDLSGRRAQGDRFLGQSGRPYYARFSMMNGPLTGRHFTLHQDTTSIGRTTGNDIIIPDLTVSRQHAILRFENGHWVVEDKNSANGTFVNNVRIRWPQPLADGDQVRFGDEIVIFNVVQ